uniref:TATA element modulatory factor 1 n=1 Tax=Takifugu rubripes TaxID=31033 RepID=A0A674P588_TAKRU
MSWFNASHLSSFAKQALSSAQKSIDRVLDIKEDDQWGDTTVMPYDDVTLPAKLSLSGGWGMTQWEAPPEEETATPPPSSEAITTPVTRTVVDESENFFNAFLSSGDIQPVPSTQVVSVPPAKSQRRPQEDKKKKEAAGQQRETESQESPSVDWDQTKESVTESNNKPQGSPDEDAILLETVSTDISDTGELPSNPDGKMGNDGEDVGSSDSVDSKSEHSRLPPVPQIEETTTKSIESSCVSSETKSTSTAGPSSSSVSKEALTEHKDSKAEDRQNDTPSPPVSAFSSGTSTTSDIEVLDHESVLSESSASSRQETGESKAGLHLMQGSFQLLTASTCADFPRLEDYSKLTESCGSSSDAFERIDSFSVQSLDSRSVSEVNSDDEIPSSRTLASVTAEGEPLMETIREQQSVDEMEESGRSATPVNSDQPEEWVEQESEANSTLVEQSSKAEVVVVPPITEDMKSFSTVQILELQKRETQLLTVSKDKAKLEEECDNLKDEILSLKAESSTVQSLKDEFTQRIADTERKAQLACKERDIAKKEIKGLREELSTRLNANDTMEIIREKEEQIRGLLEEGEKLSKQQLQHSNIIKKLRVKEKESDNRITKQQKKIKDLEEELSQLQQVLDGKEEVEKQHRENIKKLNSMVERQEKELSRLQTDTEELQENNRSLQSALDTSYKELAELHKANASRASEAEEAALSRDALVKEKLSLALEKAQEEARIQQEALANQVGDLRLALQRAEQQQARKEDYLKEEISELQQRLQEAETRNQELSQSVTSATRPLLRQIENLQASLGGQAASWEKLEKNISDRLVDSQAQLAISVEKERSASEELMSFKSQLASLESQNSLFRQEKARLLSQLEQIISIFSYLAFIYSFSLKPLKTLFSLLTALEMEKMKVEQEKKKFFLAQEVLREKVREKTSSTPTLSRSSSISGADTAGLHTSALSQDDSLDHSLTAMNLSMSMGGTNVYEAARFSGGSSIMENLQSQLKLREGEIAQLQLEISNLERTRAVMAEELVRLTNQNDDMEEKVKEIPKLKIQLKELEQRHNTILQMYGEKAEEAEELRLDLEDVKNMYKTQIDELLRNQK